MNECMLPATGGGLELASLALALVAVGALLAALSRRSHWVAVTALVVAGGVLAAGERSEAAAVDCPPRSSTSTSTSTTVTDPAAPRGFVAPLTPPGTTPGASLSVSDASPNPGGTVVVSGGGFPGDEAINIVLYSDPQILGTSTADGTGDFSMSVTIPPDTMVGAHTLAAFGGDTTATVEVIVTTRTTASSPGDAPVTTEPAPTPSEPPRRPLAENEVVFVELGGDISGNLLDNGDDLGWPPATLVAVTSLDAGFGRAPLSFGQPTPIVGRDLAGAWGDCGEVTVAADGGYHFAATAAAELVSCVVFYQLANDVDSHEGNVVFVIGDEEDLETPDATDKTVGLFGTRRIDGSLLEGDDLGVPEANLGFVADQSSFEQLSADTFHHLDGVDAAGGTVPCGTFGYAADGTYTFEAAAVTGEVTCEVVYLIANVFGDTATVTFRVTPLATLTDKTVTVLGGEQVTGSLFAGDDLGTPPAVLIGVYSTDLDVFVLVPVDTPTDLKVSEPDGDIVPCGTFSYEVGGGYTFTAADVVEQVRCGIVYLVQQHHPLVSSPGSVDATVRFVVMPADAGQTSTTVVSTSSTTTVPISTSTTTSATSTTTTTTTSVPPTTSTSTSTTTTTSTTVPPTTTTTSPTSTTSPTTTSTTTSTTSP